MPLIEHTLEGTRNKVDIAIQRIRTFEPISNGLFDTPYYVAYSGGKDSDVIRILCELAGVKHDLVHNHTTVDAPETVRYIRGIVKPENINYPKESMWQLIVRKRFPPTRIARYCCEVLKEGGGKNRFVITGVRWSESTQRKSRGHVEIQHKDKTKRVILNADNDEARRMFENCQTKGKRILNPIIDWTDADVWEFLELHGCKSNPLYQEGFRRIGCVGCPMARKAGMMREFERWPKYRDNYLRAFARMITARESAGLTVKNWETPEKVMEFWLDDSRQKKQIPGQELFEGWGPERNDE